MYIIGALAIIAIQVALIAAVIVQRARRRQAETELRENHHFIELATKAAKMGLWMRHLEKGEISANSHFRSLFGFGATNAIRFDDMLARIHPYDRGRLAFDLLRAEKDGLPFEGEFRVILADGSERWVVTRGESFNEPGGRGLRRLGALIDITDRKRAEESRREAEQDAARQRDELAHVTRNATMGELAASLAHELNQPLTAILSNAQAAQRFLAAEPVNLDEVREILLDIIDDDMRAGDVIRRIRTLVKKEKLTFAAIDLAAIIGDVLALLRSDAGLRNVEAHYRHGYAPSLARGNKVQLQQVLLNLFLNAFEAVKDSPVGARQVSATLESDAPGMVKVAVIDSGHGLSGDMLETIFEPFFTTKREGLGMGLCISRTIVEAHGGRLWAENNDGEGATFYFTVPVEKSVEGRVSRVEGRLKSPMSSPPATLFLVDDDASVRKGLARLIKSAGYQVRGFPSAQSFLDAKPLSAGPACLLLDIRMPGLNGMDLQQKLQGENAPLPIIFITGHGDIPTSVKAMKAGAVDFLPKPVHEQTLLPTIEQALARATRQQTESAALEDIRRHLSSLTPREREVMELVVSGMLNKKIAHELGTLEKTIKVHRARPSILTQKRVSSSQGEKVKLA